MKIESSWYFQVKCAMHLEKDELMIFEASDCGAVYNRICYCRHGESNPTYHLQTSSGQEYVLRKRPPGQLLPGAHRVRTVHLGDISNLHCRSSLPTDLLAVSGLSRKPRPLQRGRVCHTAAWVVTEEHNYRLAQLNYMLASTNHVVT